MTTNVTETGREREISRRDYIITMILDILAIKRFYLFIQILLKEILLSVKYKAILTYDK